MAARTKTTLPAGIQAKARQLLTWVQDHIHEYDDPGVLFISVFGPNGVGRRTFTNDAEWVAFQRTGERKKIEELIQSLVRPESAGSGKQVSNGHLSVTLRLPKSVYAALMAEASEEAVSLDQLCLFKLAAQLRELV